MRKNRSLESNPRCLVVPHCGFGGSNRGRPAATLPRAGYRQRDESDREFSQRAGKTLIAKHHIGPQASRHPNPLILRTAAAGVNSVRKRPPAGPIL